MRGRIDSYEDKLWGDLFNSDALVRQICNEGKAILRYQSKMDRKYIKLFGKETEFEGHKAIAVNKGQCNSKLFDDLKIDYPLQISYVRLPTKKWTVSLYSLKPDIDCSAIAKKHGGGGHKGAAGFQCESLPFDI